MDDSYNGHADDSPMMRPMRLRAMRLLRETWERELLHDKDRLQERLLELGNREVGTVLAVLLDSLVERGVDLRSFLPRIVDELLGDPGVAAVLHDLFDG